MSTRLVLRIQEHIQSLTRSEQKLAEVILASPQLVETHTATELAGLADVSKATAARFFRALGYADFDEVKLQAREERNRTQPYSYMKGTQSGAALGRSIGEHLDLELANLTRTFEEMNPESLRHAARLVADAPRVWFLGLGADGWLARHGRLQFARLRPAVQMLGAEGGALAEELAMIGPRDVLFVFCLGPQRRELRPILSFARTTRAEIVALSDHMNLATVKRFASIVIHCHVARHGLVSSATAHVSMLRLIAVALAGLSEDSVDRRAGLIDEISEELDFYG